MEKDLEDIVIKKVSGEPLSEEERDCFAHWFEAEEHRRYYRELVKIHSGLLAIAAEKTINKREAWRRVRPVHRIRLAYRIMRYAALLAVVVGFGWFASHKTTDENGKQTTVAEKPIANPHAAVLTLSSGEKVDLSSSPTTVQEVGANIQTGKGELTYEQAEGATETTYNTIQVPCGGMFRLQLADGTEVWLNSDSYLRYPVAFTGNERKVELKGEAYFDVAKDTIRPFIVEADAYAVRVTGTQFNVRNYPEDAVRTTLVEGKVFLEREGNRQELLPGQQGAFEDGDWKVKKVNTYRYAAWREGVCYFNGDRLEDILNELARWYDFEVYYQDTRLKEYHFTATFSRDMDLEEVINVLEKTKKIRLNIDGRTLIVRAK